MGAPAVPWNGDRRDRARLCAYVGGLAVGGDRYRVGTPADGDRGPAAFVEVLIGVTDPDPPLTT